MTPQRAFTAGIAAAITFLLAACAAPPSTTSQLPTDVTALLHELQTELVIIPAGSFRMGSDAPTAADDERPLRTVTVRSFKLARVELTSEQYAVFARAVGRAAPELDGKQPAINISWNDAQAFIAWLNATSGMKFRLPSEAEWEYAARAGSATDYWWGDAYSADYANGTGTAGRDIWMESAPVGQSPANAFGLHDMNGNVWEWTADCYVQDYAGASSDGSPATGAADCGRVLRGGSWCDTPAWMRSATRNWFDAEERFDYVGVRLAHD